MTDPTSAPSCAPPPLPSIHDRLAEARELQEAAAFGPETEGMIVTYCLEHPEQAAHVLPELEADLFARDECRYLMAWIHNLTADLGGPPTRAIVTDKVMRNITVDDDQRATKPILDLLNRKPARMEFIHAQQQLKGFIEHRRRGRLYEDDVIQAYHNRDYARWDELAQKAMTPPLLNLSDAGPFKNGLDGDDLLKMEVPEQRWLIEDVLSDAGFFVIGGPLKSMKTSALLDMAVSLATGKPFLNRFKVPEPVKVALVTVETNRNEMVTKIKKICAAKHVDSLGNLRWEPHAPRLSSPEYIGLLRAYLKQHKPRVLIVDPLYVSLEGAEHQNIMSMGPILNELSLACQENGCIPGAVHHFNRKGEVNAIPTLNDLSQAGCGEFARQWLLMRRKEAYQHDGRHNLWLVTGGSDGHAAQNVLTIDESAPKGWLTLVEDHQEAEERGRRLQNDHLVDQLITAMDRMHQESPSLDLSVNRLAKFMDVDKKVVQRAVKAGIKEEVIEEYTATISHNPTKCYRRLK